MGQNCHIDDVGSGSLHSKGGWNSLTSGVSNFGYSVVEGRTSSLITPILVMSCMSPPPLVAG